MSKFFILFSLIAAAPLTWGQALDSRSAVRQEGVSYKAYTARAKIMSQMQTFGMDRSAVDSAEEFGKAKLPAATAWENEGVMTERFKKFRDMRFLKDRNGFMRRSSWLYPDDGCFARAALAVRNVMAMPATAPNKVFVFGDLRVKTKNSPSGYVSWWYHVAPLVEVDGQKYVLDPAIEPSGPLKLEAWLATMSGTPQNLEVSVCGSGSYTPYDSCAKVSDGVEKLAESDQQGYLDQEWSRLKSMGRKPEVELGDNPPWN